MSIESIDHIAIAVRSLEESVPFYQDQLGLSLHGYEEVPEQKVRVAIFTLGPSRIELLEPTADDSPISKFLEKRGPGLHHVALRTDDIEGHLEALDKAEVPLIDKKPKDGADGMKIAFVHPKASGGVLLELSEPKS